MRTCIFVCYILITSSVFAQDQYMVTPYNPKEKFKNCDVRVFILPYVIGNGFGIAPSIGFDYGFFKRHSIGIDFGYNYNRDGDDRVADTLGMQHDEGDVSEGREKSIFFSYRYYLNFHRLREKKGIALYLSPYFRYGELESKQDPLYPNTYISQNEINRSIGIVIGGIIKFPVRMKGFDINAGIFLKHRDISTNYYEDGLVKNKFEQRNVLGLRIGLYLNLWFIKNIPK